MYDQKCSFSSNNVVSDTAVVLKRDVKLQPTNQPTNHLQQIVNAKR